MEQASVFVVPTTLLYRGRVWRIYETVETAGGWAYRLRPCPEGEPQIRKEELSREARLRAEAERLAYEAERRKAHASAWYDWALGWLPEAIQENLAEKWGFSPEEASRRNAHHLFFVFMLLSILVMVQMFVGVFTPWTVVFPLAFLESSLRWQHLAASEEAFGFTPFEAVHWLIARLRRRLSAARDGRGRGA